MLSPKRVSVFLMAGGLALLLVFISLWLKSVYQGELDSLKKETNQLFLNSIREVQDSLMTEVFGPPLIIDMIDTSMTKKIHVTKRKIDTTHTFTFRHAQSIETVGTGALEKVAIKAHPGKDDDIFGSLSVVLAMLEKPDSIEVEANVFQHKNNDLLLGFLDEEFESAMLNSELPFSYKIVQIDNEDKDIQGIWTNKYNDVISGDKFAVQFNEYSGFIWGRMVPEILFSILLFSSIALAFYFIFKNLKNQEKLNRLKNEFISNITHELKTPITTVGVAIEALRNFNALEDPAKTNEYLNISKHELNRLSILVDKVLKLSQFENKAPELKIESLDMRELIQDILNSMKLQFDKFAAKVDFQFEGSAFKLEGDRTHLTSVVYNLVDNALKYSHEQPEIEILLEQREQRVRLTVKDQGIGISEEYKNKIFDKFFRVPTGNKHNVKGYGLGLSYVASVIDQHRGSIEVESQPGGGTCFTIDLPTHHG
ncbi:MAG: HAMP domain-containing sensor histidine kinase [Bacteroidota bacterium]